MKKFLKATLTMRKITQRVLKNVNARICFMAVQEVLPVVVVHQ